MHTNKHSNTMTEESTEEPPETVTTMNRGRLRLHIGFVGCNDEPSSQKASSKTKLLRAILQRNPIEVRRPATEAEDSPVRSYRLIEPKNLIETTMDMTTDAIPIRLQTSLVEMRPDTSLILSSLPLDVTQISKCLDDLDGIVVVLEQPEPNPQEQEILNCLAHWHCRPSAPFVTVVANAPTDEEEPTTSDTERPEQRQPDPSSNVITIFASAFSEESKPRDGRIQSLKFMSYDSSSDDEDDDESKPPMAKELPAVLPNIHKIPMDATYIARLAPLQRLSIDELFELLQDPHVLEFVEAQESYPQQQPSGTGYSKEEETVRWLLQCSSSGHFVETAMATFVACDVTRIDGPSHHSLPTISARIDK